MPTHSLKLYFIQYGFIKTKGFFHKYPKIQAKQQKCTKFSKFTRVSSLTKIFTRMLLLSQQWRCLLHLLFFFSSLKHISSLILNTKHSHLSAILHFKIHKQIKKTLITLYKQTSEEIEKQHPTKKIVVIVNESSTTILKDNN